MDWNLFAAVVIGIVIATMATEKWLKPKLPVPEPPSDNNQVGYSSSDPVRNFLDNYS